MKTANVTKGTSFLSFEFYTANCPYCDEIMVLEKEQLSLTYYCIKGFREDGETFTLHLNKDPGGQERSIRFINDNRDKT